MSRDDSGPTTPMRGVPIVRVSYTQWLSLLAGSDPSLLTNVFEITYPPGFVDQLELGPADSPFVVAGPGFRVLGE